MKKPKVNESCIGCGTCEGICPAVFKIKEVDGKSIAVVQPADYEAEKESIEKAIQSCPTQAIEWEE